MSRNACNGENGKKCQKAGHSELDAKSGPMESGDFGKNAEFGTNGEKSPGPLFGTNSEKSPKGWQYPECGKYSNWMPNFHLNF